MCLTFFCSRPSNNKKVKFIIGFNREEQSLRETRKFGQFEEDPNVYGGRDIKSGGTWLGLNIKTGLLVFLTNYDLPDKAIRMGLSRGKLVYRFLSTSFIPEGLESNKVDDLIKGTLQEVSKMRNQYSPFNLTVFNMRSGQCFYICSEWNQKNPSLLQSQVPYGICNCDIETIWSKTQHGMEMFKKLLDQLGQLQQPAITEQLLAIFKDKKRFSEIDDDQSSIFVQPYWCVLQKAERMTKSTFVLLLIEHQNKSQLLIKQVTYSREGAESAIDLTLFL